MYFVGIDISKYKHDCFIVSETGEVIEENLSFTNANEGFNQLLNLLNYLDNSQEIRIGFEATGHYGMNLKLFLEKNNYSFMEFNPALVKRFISTQTLRRTKTDMKDVMLITKYLISVDYKPHPKQFYHKYSLKSLSRLREKLVKQRSYYEVQITNTLDIIFPEFKPFFNNDFSKTCLYILNKYITPDKIKTTKDFDSIRKVSCGKFTYANFIKLKELAKNSIGISNDIFETELESLLTLHSGIEVEINKLENKIKSIIKELNPPILSIKGIGMISCAGIISEFGDISKFPNASKMLSFAGLEPGIIESGTMSSKGKMVKRGSGYLRYSLMNVALTVIRFNNTFYDYYYKKVSEGKCHRVALSHVCKKIIRVIYILETKNIQFDPSLLK